MKPHTIIPITAAIDETFDPPFRRFWWLKRIALLFIAFVCFVIGSWFWLMHRAERQLAAEIQEWKKEGLPIETRDFEEPPLPDEENAAVGFNKAVHAIVDMKAYEKADYSDTFDKRPWNAATMTVANETIAINHAAFSELRSARRLTKTRWDLGPQIQAGHWNHNWHRIDWTPIRQFARITRMAAMAAHERGDDASFLEYLHDLQFIAETTLCDTEIISSLIGNGIDSMAASMVGEVADELQLQTPELKAETKARMAAWLTPRQVPAKWLYFARDAVILREIYQDRQLMLYPIRDKPLEQFEPAVWRILEPLRMERVATTLRNVRQMVHISREQNWPAISPKLSSIHSSTWVRTRVEPLDLFAHLMVSDFSGFETCLKTMFRKDRGIGTAAMRLACRLYAIDHEGKNPVSLEQLVPEYLPAVPSDPFDANGHSLRLHSATTQPFIYSLGTVTDMVATGKWMPTLSQHEDYRSAIFVSFLNPHPRAVTTQPTTQNAQ